MKLKEKLAREAWPEDGDAPCTLCYLMGFEKAREMVVRWLNEHDTHEWEHGYLDVYKGRQHDISLLGEEEVE